MAGVTQLADSGTAYTVSPTGLPVGVIAVRPGVVDVNVARSLATTGTPVKPPARSASWFNACSVVSGCTVGPPAPMAASSVALAVTDAGSTVAPGLLASTDCSA